MRFSALAMTCLIATVTIATVGCERPNADAPSSTQDAAPSGEIVIAEAPVSDELPGLPAAATGISFWDHPTLSFNSTMIIATSKGVVAYSMEDGNEVSRIDGFNADGVATGYLGFGPSSAGFIAFLDADENAFTFFGVDNNSRAFLPLDAGPAIRGAVRGFCLGRDLGASAPSLFIVQKGVMQVFNLKATASGVAVESNAVIDTPNNLVSCTVGLDGVLFAASDRGDIFKLAGDTAFAAPFAQASIADGTLGIVASVSEEDPSVINSQLAITDMSTGIVQLFDTADGASLGAVKVVATDTLPGVDGAESFAITGGNLGGLYRNGVAAFGVANGAEGPVLRITPTSSLKNALQLSVGEPVSPRGVAAPVTSDTLIIPIEIQPGEPE